MVFSAAFIFGVTADPASAQQQTGPPSIGYSPAAPDLTVAEDRISNCGDALSEALEQSATGMPCWSDIRAVDHWNTLNLGSGMTVRGNTPVNIPGSNAAGFSYTAGSIDGFLFQSPANAQTYGGIGAFSGFLRMRKWQLTFEDGGAGLDFRLLGNNRFVGMNRGAFRASGQLAERWLWQAGATNTYGNDVLRTAGPLDYRKIGGTKSGSLEAPVADVVAYGLHSGNLVDEQEDAKADFQESRRTSLGISAAHTFRHYEDDGGTIETERIRTEALHSLSQNAALGLFAAASRQAGPARCSLAGLGAVGLLQWGSHASISASGALDGASNDCGKKVQSTGDFSLYLRTAPRTDLFLSGNRDLSGGVVEQAILLNSASAGIRQRIGSGASIRLTGAAVHFNDVGTNLAHTGTFAEADALFPLGRTLLYEAAYRHFQISSLPVTDNRNVLTFSLWWSPKRTEPVLTAHR
jgi:hypothetical protein